ncbi:MAG: AAA domain-containing protein, partial [Clostridia bacterium]|nr:AAA domain-containing protein [Clostridia bacterium]
MNFTLEQLSEQFKQENYICGEDILVPVYLALKLKKPLLVAGAPGVGKTEIAKVLSNVLKTELIRLQCYEGLDENKALYEWNYQKQLLYIQAEKGRQDRTVDIFSR